MVENEAGTPSKRPWSHGPWNSFMGAVAGIYDATGARIGFFNRAEDAEYVVSLSARIAALEAQLAEKVRVKPLVWRDVRTPGGGGWWYAQDPLGGLNYLATSEEDKTAKEERHRRRILSALEATPAPMVTATHRHKKRGTEYVLLGFGKMQSENWEDVSSAYDEGGYIGGTLVDMREVAIYRSIDDGSLWVRPREEFEDGRFEALTAAQEAGK